MTKFGFAAKFCCFDIDCNGANHYQKSKFPNWKIINGYPKNICSQQTIYYTLKPNQEQKPNASLTNKSNDTFFDVLPPDSVGVANFIRSKRRK